MGYIPNPKTDRSGVVCAIPHNGEDGPCPVRCRHCFCQEGRSYLEPLIKNLPNMPRAEQVAGCLVRICDGYDCNYQREVVMAATEKIKKCPHVVGVFHNTSMPIDLEGFVDPVVLTVNPGKKTDKSAHLIKTIPKNLMFVRVRVNTWNLELVDEVVAHYTAQKIPVILTFMAYYCKEVYESVPEGHEGNYSFRQRTENKYWVITPEAWDMVLERYKGNTWVYPCGKTANDFACHRCGNCLREYFYTMEKMKREEAR